MAETIPSVSEVVAGINQTFAEMELPPGNPELRRRVRELVEQGCDEGFLLQVSWLYAYTALAFRRNAETER